MVSVIRFDSSSVMLSSIIAVTPESSSATASLRIWLASFVSLPLTEYRSAVCGNNPMCQKTGIFLPTRILMTAGLHPSIFTPSAPMSRNIFAFVNASCSFS